MPERPSRRARRNRLAARAQYRCEYCRCPQGVSSSQVFSIEHIVPKARGGTDGLANLALACEGCNNPKGTKVEAVDPATGELVPLFHPRTQSWRQHFHWTDDYERVVGLTPTGRATVSALTLNRSNV